MVHVHVLLWYCTCMDNYDVITAPPTQVIDPNMDPKGQKISGELIKAPSEEVLEYREKNPHNTILVRFFDGRRTW